MNSYWHEMCVRVCVSVCVCAVGAFSTDILKQYEKEECTNPRIPKAGVASL